MDSFFEQLPAIIEKSAASPLSLLALIIIASSIIAFLLFKDASEKARMRIFVMLFTGVLLLGFQVLSSVTNPTAPAGEAPPPASATPVSTASASGDSAPARGSAPREPAGEPEMIEQPAPPNPDRTDTVARVQHDLSGTWYAPDGVSYAFEQSGDRVQFEEWNPLVGQTAEGTGTLVGARLEVSYATALGTTGVGSLQVSPDGETLSGSVTDLVTGARMPVMLFRED